MPLSPLNNINLSDIRLIASDVDGTLTQNGKFQAIRKSHDVDKNIASTITRMF